MVYLSKPEENPGLHIKITSRYLVLMGVQPPSTWDNCGMLTLALSVFVHSSEVIADRYQTTTCNHSKGFQSNDIVEDHTVEDPKSLKKRSSHAVLFLSLNRIMGNVARLFQLIRSLIACLRF